MLIMSYIGDQVWFITSKQTDPDLQHRHYVAPIPRAPLLAYISSMLGWNIRFTKPMLGLLYGY